jgi:hypothetical protein
MLAAPILLSVLGFAPQSDRVLDPWSKAADDGSRVLSVDPDERSGLGSAHTMLRDEKGREIWSRELGYSLRSAEITRKGEVLGWALRAAVGDRPPGLALVILGPDGSERAMEWIDQEQPLCVRGIVAAPDSDRAIFRLEPFVDSFCGTYLLERARTDREEWRVVRLSDGAPLARFIPPVLQREGIAYLARVVALRERQLLVAEATFESNDMATLVLLDLEGHEVWRVVEREDWHQPDGFFAWRFTGGRLSAGSAPGEFRLQRSTPDELVRWRVEPEADGLGPWRVVETAREPRALQLDPGPGIKTAQTVAPRILGERRLVALTDGHPCSVGTWSDAAIDAQGRLVVLEAEDAHLHRFDAQGDPMGTIELQEASKAVDHILGVRADRIDLSVGDSFATWKGERLTMAYDRWHHALTRPANHRTEGPRWFMDSHALLRCANDDPQGDVTARLARHPDGTWFAPLEGAAVAEDGSVVTIDRGAQDWSMIGNAESVVSRFDAQGVGKEQLRARLGGATNLRVNRRWLAGNAFGSAACFLIDFDSKQVFGLGREFHDWTFRVLLPDVQGEFWIVDLRGKRLLRAALPRQ